MKPTAEQLAAVSAQVEQLSRSDNAFTGLANAFHYLQKRNQRLEEILRRLEYFLQFGMPAEEHARLLKLVEQVREQDFYEENRDESGFGL